MTWSRQPLDLRRVRAYPLAERENLLRLDEILVDPAAAPPAVDAATVAMLDEIAGRVRAARSRGASVMLVFGAHLVKNGAALLVERLIRQGWLTHLATNGAAAIHDWELAWQGRTGESVRQGVAAGRFGTWDETGRHLHVALLAAGITGEGYGRAVARLIGEDGTTLPEPDALAAAIRSEPDHPLTAARADLLAAMREHGLPPGRYAVEHPHKAASLFAAALRHDVPITVHPGVGYDIIATHPMFHGAAIGRAAQRDFAQFAAAVEGLDDGVVLSVGSAIMGPQVFEKSLSCANNLRLQSGRATVSGHAIYVVDLQPGGGWDWSASEPPATNPAYYLRFCKSYARMGGAMRYVLCDNVAFLQHVLQRLAG